jgi:hypothetical protein
MATLLPIADCKVTDVNAFRTPLMSKFTSSSFSLSEFFYGTPLVDNAVTFLRNEQLTNVEFTVGFTNTTGSFIPSTSIIFNISLTNFRPCTVSSSNPAVVTITSHGYTTGDKVRFSASVTPVGIIRGIPYFVNVQSANTFWIYDTLANAIAGGVTGRVATTSTGTSVVCNKVIEEKTYSQNDIFGNTIQNRTVGSNEPVIYFVSEGWTTVIDNVAGKWGFMLSMENPAILSRGVSTLASAVSSTICWGTAIQSAISGTDSFCFSKKIDMTSGFILNGQSMITGKHNVDPFLYPNFIVDPTQGTIGNITISTLGRIYQLSFSGFSIGKPLEFTSNILLGSTSATLTSNFDGISGTYKVQLLQLTKDDDKAQIDMTFTNGSPNVTFSSVVSNYANYAVVCMPTSSAFKINTNEPFNGFGSSSNAYGHSATMCSENNKNTWTTLDTSINIGATSLVTKDVTNWVIGDTFFVGGINAIGTNLSENTVYTITNITSSLGKDTITFTPAISTYNRVTNGAICLNTSVTNGIDIVRVTGSANNTFTGTFASQIICGFNGRYMQYTSNINSSSNPTFVYNRTTYFYDLYNNASFSFINSFGGVFSKNISVKTTAVTIGVELSTFRYLKTSLFERILFLTGSVSSISRKKVNYENIHIETNVGQTSLSVSLSPTSNMNNIKIWNTTNLGRGLAFGGIKGKMTNVYIDNTSIAIGFNSTSVKNYISNFYLGTISPNTIDVSSATTQEVYVDSEINKIFSNPLIDFLTLQTFISEESYLRITDINNVIGEVRVIQKYGQSYMTGSGLSDTTLHDGNPAIKLRSNDSVEITYWEQVIPTGNIQNKDMMIGVWAKINNSAYWAGVHEMPRLTITYDNGTIVYKELNQSTDWQFISLPFRPLTDFASVVVAVSTKTDATGTDADVYFADYSVLYPAGYTLNLGIFDNVNAGFPTTPTISTSVSAQDVWAADPTQFGANTVGDKVNKIKKIVTGLQ